MPELYLPYTKLLFKIYYNNIFSLTGEEKESFLWLLDSSLLSRYAIQLWYQLK